MHFDPVDLTILNSPAKTFLPHEIWIPILEHGCEFPPQVFVEVMLNLIKNPNINSSHLFRADILYDSHGILASSDEENVQNNLIGTWKKHGIFNVDLADLKLERTIIRKLIPRNAQLDNSLVQTCHLFRSKETSPGEKNLVLYLPHVSAPDEVPHYHPAVRGIAFLHDWKPSEPYKESQCGPKPGTIAIHYAPYPSTELTDRLRRTAYQLLSVLHKHGRGSLAGYVKRVHLDQIIPQQRVQDTYAALKAKHAKRLIDHWVEQTEPSKHVFEDLGIAAFLIELWRDTYGDGQTQADARENSRNGFPGFVDIGCGNGVLVDVLIKEGYQGWGFDARKRKTWDTFTPDVRANLKQLILIPQPILDMNPDLKLDDIETRSPLPPSGGTCTLSPNLPPPPQFHNGIFSPSTFIISNHADELTPWTPLLASLSHSAFLAIPCCSHDLSGARARARANPHKTTSNTAEPLLTTNPSVNTPNNITTNSTNSTVTNPNTTTQTTKKKINEPEKGDLTLLSPQSRANGKQPSAYSSLVSWVVALAEEMGYVVEKEVLRIPSTRNVAVIGRSWAAGEMVDGGVGKEREGGWRKDEGVGGTTGKGEGERERAVRVRVEEIVRREGGDGVVGWVDRATALARGQGSGKGH